MNEIPLSNLWRPDGRGVVNLEGRALSAKKPNQSDPGNIKNWFTTGNDSNYILHTRYLQRKELLELDTIGSDSQAQGGDAHSLGARVFMDM